MLLEVLFYFLFLVKVHTLFKSFFFFSLSNIYDLQQPSSNQQVYFRVKRHKSTIFLPAKTTDKILTLKKNIIKILGDSEKIDPKKLKLLISADDSEPPHS